MLKTGARGRIRRERSGDGMRPPEPTDYPRPAGAAPTVGSTCPRAPGACLGCGCAISSGDHPPPSALQSCTTETSCNRCVPVRASSGFKQIPLRDQDIQVVGQSAFIPKIRQPQGRPQGIDLLCLCIPLVTRQSAATNASSTSRNATSTACSYRASASRPCASAASC